jgi:sortase A
MDNGAIKLPSTAFPWQDNGNTYIAAHRVGYSGTPSYNQFYDLPSMQKGDEIILSDANGTVYTYEVTDVFAVMPHENWVTDPEPGRDMVTLQTCVASVDDWTTITPGLLSSPPGPETARLVVQADRVDVQQG